MLPKVFTFVDIETTGTSPRFDRIIEIGAIRVENNKVVKEFSTLLNPQRTFDPFIQSLTGISPEELKDQPTFYEVKDELLEVLSESVFVAHNVMFDYGFIKSEFRRLEQSFTLKNLCTVKLSRALYPRFKRHNLDALINRFNLSCERRHRALDDAKVIWGFYQKSLEKFGEEKVFTVISTVMKRPSRPVGISEDVIDSLPESAGVYIFYDGNNAPLYIGKSKNLRNRVLSHFSNSKNQSVDMKIAQDVKRIETIETAGELGALLLEATYIKKFQPLLNRQLRYAYKLLALKKVETVRQYYSLEVHVLQDIPLHEMDQVLGIFKSNKQLKGFLHTIAKDYQLCPKLLGIEKTKKSCFSYHLGICHGACISEENVLKYNLRFDDAFYKTKIKRWPFDGPIAIKEENEKEEIFIVDKWCVLGSIKNEGEFLDDITSDYSFDTDTYRILAKYLIRNKNLQIVQLPNDFHTNSPS